MAKRKKVDGATGTMAVETPDEARDESRDIAGEERSEALDMAIAERAYQIYRERGGTDGRALDDWLQAEDELSRRRVSAGKQRRG